MAKSNSRYSRRNTRSTMKSETGSLLYAAVSARAALLWVTARSRPGLAALLSVGGLASGAALSWLAASAHVVERVAEALGR